MHHYVLAELSDGSKVDGIITGVDEKYVYLAVPDTSRNVEEERGYPGYGYPPFGYPGYGFPPYYYGPGAGFRRLILPLAALTAISTLPFWWY